MAPNGPNQQHSPIPGVETPIAYQGLVWKASSALEGLMDNSDQVVVTEADGVKVERKPIDSLISTPSGIVRKTEIETGKITLGIEVFDIDRSTGEAKKSHGWEWNPGDTTIRFDQESDPSEWINQVKPEAVLEEFCDTIEDHYRRNPTRSKNNLKRLGSTIFKRR